MITTAKGPESKTGKKYTARVTTLFDFGSFAAVQEGRANTARRAYYRRLLAYALDRCLTGKQRETVRLYYLEGKKLREISQELGVSASTLSRRLACARRRLYRFANDAAVVERLQRQAK